MPYTNQTPNYGLPQYIATDKPTYLGDANGAYSKLDTQLKANADATTANQNSVNLLSARVLSNETSIADRYTKAETAERFTPRPSLGRNGNFRQPVNQRGDTSYTGGGTGAYSIDGWKLTPSGNYNVTTRTLSGASYTSRACGIFQLCELSSGNLAVGDTISVTLSVGGQVYTASMSLANQDAYSKFSDVPAGFSNDDFEIVPVAYSASNPTVYSVGVYAKKALTLDFIKWEKGPIATPYMPKEYGAELAECQRYYLRVPAWQMIGSGYVQYDGALIAVMMPTPCTMRTNPSINSISGTFYFGNGTTSSYTGTPGVVSCPGWVAISFTGTFEHQNQTVAFLLSNSTVDLSADL